MDHYGGLSCLAVIGSVMDQHSNTGTLHAANNGPTVTLGGPLPLPTTAAQSGAWNVGIAGTPNVAAAQNGRWNVGITGTPNVNVTNDVAVRNVDEKGRVPYMQGAFQTCSAGNTFCDMSFPAVPAGMRLVVEHVSANIGVTAGSSIKGTFLLANGMVFSLPGRAMATPTLVGVNEQVLAYYEAGQVPVYRVVFSAASASGTATSVISGYLVNLSQ
jgi:hypothetical protein